MNDIRQCEGVLATGSLLAMGSLLYPARWKIRKCFATSSMQSIQQSSWYCGAAVHSAAKPPCNCTLVYSDALKKQSQQDTCLLEIFRTLVAMFNYCSTGPVSASLCTIQVLGHTKTAPHTVSCLPGCHSEQLTLKRA